MNRIDFLLSPSLHYWIDSITFILFYSLDGRKLECLMPSATKWTFQPVWISPQGEIPIIHVGPKKKKIIKRMLLLETLWPPPSWEKAEISMCADGCLGFPSICITYLSLFVLIRSENSCVLKRDDAPLICGKSSFRSFSLICRQTKSLFQF